MISLPALALASETAAASPDADGFWGARWNPPDWAFVDVPLRKREPLRLERALSREATRSTQAHFGRVEAPPRLTLAAGIAHPGGEVTDDQHRDVTEVLELAEQPKHHRPAEGHVGGGRVDAQFDSQRSPLFEQLAQAVLGQQRVDPVCQDRELFVYREEVHG